MTVSITNAISEVFKGEPRNITKSIRVDYDSLGNKCLYFTHGNYTKCLSLSNLSNIMIKQYGTSDFDTANFIDSLTSYLVEVDFRTLYMSMEIEYFKYIRRNK